MINNRQAGRRNRGRNNGRQNGGNRGGDNGNRVDNRARGNAPQLLEKYRNLARDAQLAGDRVNTEYYLQFADHYFRVIADNRARQEDHQTRFRRNDESLDDDFDQDEMSSGESQSQRETAEADDARTHRNRNGRQPTQQPRYEPRPARVEVRKAADNAESPIREARVRETGVREAADAEAPVREAPAREAGVRETAGEGVRESAEAAAPKRRGRKPREPRADDTAQREVQPGIDLAALPPAIARADNDSDEGEAPAPRRRGRPRRATAEAAE